MVTGRDVAERGRRAVESAPAGLRRPAPLEAVATQHPKATGEQHYHAAHPEPRRHLSINTGEPNAGAHEDHDRREELPVVLASTSDLRLVEAAGIWVGISGVELP